MANTVDVFLVLNNVGQFVSGAKEAAGGVKEVGKATEETGNKAKAGWKQVAKWAGGAVAIAGATKFAKGAFDATRDLASSTMALQRSTGLEAEEASKWSALTKERGIQAGALNTSLVKLSKQMQTAAGGTAKEAATVAKLRDQMKAVSAAGGKDAPKALKKLEDQLAKATAAGDKSRATMDKLGVSQEELAKGDVAAVMLKSADTFKAITNPAERAALATQLYGKQGQALLPILMQGREGVEKMLDEQKAAGKYLTAGGVQGFKDYAKNQRDLNRNFDGLKIQVGTALLPVFVNVSKALLSVSNLLRPITSNSKVLTGIVVGLTAAFVAYKATMVIVNVVNALFGITMAAWPIFLIIAGIIALVAVFIILYKRVDWFRAAVDALWAGFKAAMSGIQTAAAAVFNWIKTYWPVLAVILLGPFGIVVINVVKHFDTIKAAAKTVFDWLKQTAGTIAAPFIKAFEAIMPPVKAALNLIIRGWNSLKFKVPGWAEKKVGGVTVLPAFGGFEFGVPKIPALQAGGIITGAGAALVGERGPELVALPAGAAVAPLSAGPLQIVVPVNVDGRELARVVARVTSDQLARR